MMPGGMNGVQLAESVQSVFPELPVLLTTGYAGAADDLGARGLTVIAKPYKATQLCAAVGDMMGKLEMSTRHGGEIPAFHRSRAARCAANAAVYAINIAAALLQLDRSHAEEYRKRAKLIVVSPPSRRLHVQCAV
jgi:DNA-binding NtrC family response regulator